MITTAGARIAVPQRAGLALANLRQPEFVNGASFAVAPGAPIQYGHVEDQSRLILDGEKDASDAIARGLSAVGDARATGIKNVATINADAMHDETQAKIAKIESGTAIATGIISGVTALTDGIFKAADNVHQDRQKERDAETLAAKPKIVPFMDWSAKQDQADATLDLTKARAEAARAGIRGNADIFTDPTNQGAMNGLAGTRVESGVAVDGTPTSGVATEFGYNDPQDNGEGAWGDSTDNTDIKGVSLPTSVLREHFGDENLAHGQMVEVTNPKTGVSNTYPIIDKGPSTEVIAKNGPTIDLTHAANAEMGGDGKTEMQWKILARPAVAAGTAPLSGLSLNDSGHTDLSLPIASSDAAPAATPTPAPSAAADWAAQHAGQKMLRSVPTDIPGMSMVATPDGRSWRLVNTHATGPTDSEPAAPDLTPPDGMVLSGVTRNSKGVELPTFKPKDVMDAAAEAGDSRVKLAENRATRQEQTAFYNYPPIKIFEGQNGVRQALPRFYADYQDATTHPTEAGIHDIGMLDMYAKAEAGGRVTESQAKLALDAKSLPDKMEILFGKPFTGATLSQGQRDSMLRVVADNYNSGADIANQSVESARQRLMAQGVTDEKMLPKPYVLAKTRDDLMSQIGELKAQAIAAEQAGKKDVVEELKKQAVELAGQIKKSKGVIVNMDDIRKTLQGFGGGGQGVTIDDGTVQ